MQDNPAYLFFCIVGPNTLTKEIHGQINKSPTKPSHLAFLQSNEHQLGLLALEYILGSSRDNRE
jgi:hypothetical protein